ncbi:Cilia- and flagella-associated protein 100 [Acropora cervicornis]|uniref:Cilia- and flagella-associated protein 100 n=1 Tax=Acropora cervicornis TaxID=6130 RepID=A0AAD9R2D3_ACRCE|nr:Cilia- and flagella-associated protein 100 [Acropora cervicornis]
MSLSPSQASNKQPRSGRQSATRQSEKVAFTSGKSSFSGNHSAVSVIESVVNPKKNPFSVPQDNDERVQQRSLKVHEKTTYTSRVNAKTAAMRKIGGESEDEFFEEEIKKEKDGVIAVKDDPQFTLAITRDRHVEKENLADFISKKREMFLVQYSLGVKRDEMRKLEEIAQAEEKKLELAEQYLEEDAAMFDEFLKENDKNSVEAIKIAEAETKLKLEKVAEIKKINAQMMAIKSEISKNEDTLKEYMLYKQFLDSLTPQASMNFFFFFFMYLRTFNLID